MGKYIILVLFFSLLSTSSVVCDDDSNCTEFKQEITSANFTKEIYLLYYYGPTVHDYIKIPYENALSISEQNKFDTKKDTVFYFHGWTEQPSNHTESVDTIAEAFLSRNIVNLVVFDYSVLVKGHTIDKYLDSFRNVSDIGEAIGFYLKCYIPKIQPIEKVHLIGHSLGAQVMSKAARVYGEGKLAWLTGLDPAGPIFNIPLIEHLSKTDALFVDIIHTDSFNYGDGRSIGHVDFFPNMGRRVQPSCPTNNSYEFCSHHMSWRFYAESVKNETYYPAQKCNYNFFCNSFGISSNFPYCCDKNAPINHMGYGVNKTNQGDFYLKTSPDPPYDLGTQGYYG